MNKNKSILFTGTLRKECGLTFIVFWPLDRDIENFYFEQSTFLDKITCMEHLCSWKLGLIIFKVKNRHPSGVMPA